MNYSDIANNLNSNLSSLDSSVNSIKKISFDGVWSGESANTQTSNLKTATNKLSGQRDNISNFINALNKLQTYKDNKDKISSLSSSLKYYMDPDAASYNSSIYSQIDAIEKDNTTLKGDINSLINSISPVSTQFEIVTYTPEETYKDYIVDLADFYKLFRSGSLSELATNDSLFNYIPEQQIVSELNKIKGQYSGRDAAVNCALGIMNMAASIGKMIDYHLEEPGHTYYHKEFPLGELVNGTDCVSFVSWAINQGSSNPFVIYNTTEFKSKGKKTSFQKAQKGDIITFDHHVALVVDNDPSSGKMLVAEAAGSGKGIVLCARSYKNLSGQAQARDMSEYYR